MSRHWILACGLPAVFALPALFAASLYVGDPAPHEVISGISFEGPLDPSGATAIMACSTSFSQIAACTLTTTKNVNTNNTQSYTLTNKHQFEAQTFLLSCVKSGPISSCSTPSSLVVNANASGSFTLSYLTAGTEGAGTVTVTATGDYDQVSATLTVNVVNPTPPPTPFHLIDVTPDYQEQEPAPNSGGSSSFQVRNQGTTSEIYVIEKSCTGLGASCTGSATEITVGAGASSTEVIAFTAGGTVGSSGVIKLLARQKSNSAVRDSGLVAVTVASKTPGLEVTSLNPGPTFERDLCLTLSVGSNAAVQCGDLRIVHPLPATRTRNATRAPVLIYSSQQAHPYPLVAAELTVTSDSVPQSVTARLLIGGVEYASGSWSGADWAAGGTRRIALAFDGQNLATGVYAYQFEVTRQYAGGTRTNLQGGELVLVNRLDSQFGGGWWLAGLEQLAVGTNLLWMGADGSALKYTPHPTLATCGSRPHSTGRTRSPTTRRRRPTRAGCPGSCASSSMGPDSTSEPLTGLATRPASGTARRGGSTH